MFGVVRTNKLPATEMIKNEDDLVKRNFSADRPDPCEAVLLRSVTLRIFKLIQAGSIPPLLLMCSHEQLLAGKYLHE